MTPLLALRVALLPSQKSVAPIAIMLETGRLLPLNEMAGTCVTLPKASRIRAKYCLPPSTSSVICF